MIYRKLPSRPPRLVLRIAAVGAAAAAGFGAAGCNDGPAILGVVYVSPSGDLDAASPGSPDVVDEEPAVPATPVGLVAMPEGGPCNGGPCGTVVMPDADAGQSEDADARAPLCGVGFCGVVVMPHDGG